MGKIGQSICANTDYALLILFILNLYFSQNIVNFVGACWGEDLTCLVLEWVPKGSLQQLLKNQVCHQNLPSAAYFL
jgi:serine/threonine protein kinase